MARGRFITFEGGEGCGKSTQVVRLAAALEERGLKVLLTREPGGTRLSELIRTLLKDEAEDPPVDRAELLLFLAARAQLVRNVIAPALEAGTWVVSDRFSDSTVAYQGYGRGLPVDFVRQANDFACEGLRPDLTFLLDLDPATAEAIRNGSTPMSIRRGNAPAASFVCRVENTMWPVSEALMAISAVSRSRISPTIIMSGSWRRNALSARAKVMPISLCI